jgi:3-hydroxyacyl-[acyl-carrier-protein] dehydratase
VKTSYGAREVEALLPHRGHALFVREAEVEGSTVRGTCDWDAAHPHLQGHFPDYPIVPGVFLVEAAAQLAGVLIAAGNPGQPGVGLLAGVRRTLVHSPVAPGDTVTYELDVRANPGGIFDIKGVGRFADGSKAISLDLIIAVRVPTN